MQLRRVWALAAFASLFSAGTGSVAFAEMAQAATGVTVPSSISADCSTDVSASLGAFLASVGDGTQINFPLNGCYRVETEIDIANKSGWVLHGNGTLLKRTQPTPAALQYPRANAFLRFVNLSDSTVDGVNILGINTVSDLSYLRPSYGAYDSRYPFDHGFAFEGATNVVVSNSKIDAVYGDGVYISGGDQYTSHRSSDVTIRGVTIDRNGRQGMSVSRSSGVVIDGVNIEHSRRAGIDLEPDSASEIISNIEIKNSVLHSWLLAFAAGGPGAVNNVNIHDNTVTGSGVPFVQDVSTLGTARSNWQVVDNKVTTGLGSPQPAMKFANTSGVVVKGNYVPVATSQSRLEVGLQSNTTNAQILCNQFPGGGNPYITTDTTSSFTAAGNSLDSTAPVCTQPVASSPPATATSTGSGPTTPAPPSAPPVTTDPTAAGHWPAPSISSTATTDPTAAGHLPAPTARGTTPTAPAAAGAAATAGASTATQPPSAKKTAGPTTSAKATPTPKSRVARHGSSHLTAAAVGGSNGPTATQQLANLDYETVATDAGPRWFSRIISPALIAALSALLLTAAIFRKIKRGTGLAGPRRIAVAITGPHGSDVLPGGRKR